MVQIADFIVVQGDFIRMLFLFFSPPFVEIFYRMLEHSILCPFIRLRSFSPVFHAGTHKGGNGQNGQE
jgi:hypothetical protein